MIRRLSPEHLSRWRATYTVALTNYKRGSIDESEAETILLDLNYKNGALDIELNEWCRLRSQYRIQQGRNP
jgi:hypothetical protein